jgi:peroxiredoxin
MKHRAIFVLVLLLLGCDKKDQNETERPASGQDEFTAATLVTVGDKVPDFTYTTLDGQSISLSELRGKVVLISFFATWCPPCLREMPYLQSEVFEKITRKDFCMIAIGREHQAEELVEFKRQKGLAFPMAADPDRSIYSLFAKAYIPRNFVVGKDGTIRWVSGGLSKSQFPEMVSLIQRELQKAVRPADEV